MADPTHPTDRLRPAPSARGARRAVTARDGDLPVVRGEPDRRRGAGPARRDRGRRRGDSSAARSAAVQRSRLLSWISGDYPERRAPIGRPTPRPSRRPTSTVQREILRLELEAEVANLQAEADAILSEARSSRAASSDLPEGIRPLEPAGRGRRRRDAPAERRRRDHPADEAADGRRRDDRGRGRDRPATPDDPGRDRGRGRTETRPSPPDRPAAAILRAVPDRLPPPGPSFLREQPSASATGRCAPAWPGRPTPPTAGGWRPVGRRRRRRGQLPRRRARRRSAARSAARPARPGASAARCPGSSSRTAAGSRCGSGWSPRPTTRPGRGGPAGGPRRVPVRAGAGRRRCARTSSPRGPGRVPPGDRGAPPALNVRGRVDSARRCATCSTTSWRSSASARRLRARARIPDARRRHGATATTGRDADDGPCATPTTVRRRRTADGDDDDDATPTRTTAGADSSDQATAVAARTTAPPRPGGPDDGGRARPRAPAGASGIGVAIVDRPRASSCCSASGSTCGPTPCGTERRLRPVFWTRLTATLGLGVGAFLARARRPVRQPLAGRPALAAAATERPARSGRSFDRLNEAAQAADERRGRDARSDRSAGAAVTRPGRRRRHAIVFEPTTCPT